jgi:hypothetical protein
MALQQALLERAADIAGGFERLARQLGTDALRLQRWRAGELRLPESIFLRLVDIVLKDDVARALADRRRHARSLALPDRLSYCSLPSSRS